MHQWLSNRLIRMFDLFFVVIAILALIFPAFMVALAIKLTSPGPVLYWSKRIGKNRTQFLMPKFRTMKIDTPAVATHLLSDANHYITPIGVLLRKSSLDEIPQLWSILRGEMAIVGPRPALFNQYDLIDLRESFGVNSLVPGLTGWAQVNGRDNLTIEEKVKFDVEYLQLFSFIFNLKIIWLTFVKVLSRESISH